jgi:hypothetical protein
VSRAEHGHRRTLADATLFVHQLSGWIAARVPRALSRAHESQRIVRGSTRVADEGEKSY